MKSQKKFKAFTLIEVLISIIIIGIVMATIPIMMTAFTTSVKTNIKEEVFFSQFSLLNIIVAKYFDENNTVGENYYKDLNATNGDSELLINAYTDGLYRIGKHQIEAGTKSLITPDFRSGSADTVSHIGPDANEPNETTYDDIDDYNGYGEHHAGVESQGYDLNVTVKYIPDSTNYWDTNITFTYTSGVTTTATNIKLITITTVLKDGTVIKLSYPRCNIGRSAMLSYK
ncbi:prepilin-type N-terminal cleavage/methylation domain-containing protein [Caminibacter pacificus]|uniref:Prepilin-type N-terminal cleavage/methylation domain-containing protein n=1 Tax=Caminibacter pacificus TaxID=1424653 RepID=A0AAJ4UYI7_9BACT|nr:prepilin-type N-terminal cleavage/methylation domain-containing protein [Caminibacter pacificus]NPA88353.1 prepilin-type N-terminal cleavage/methylation domain-containing protein [Campylobacterota bacterium]QCI28500.1 prepilin-type N-terminal cleavage/methylation domain-containing protein [Caminibacter pacificus]ROR40774.1 prepilin-type N-terminal cleavage/methylation domain-containing protein [Caminibacter pacificus]